MGGNELRTTISASGIGTSFIHDDGRTYFVSTVENPAGSARYETLIKIAHEQAPPICLVDAASPKDAVINHIAVSRMAVSSDRANWSENSAVGFVPVTIINLLESSKSEADPARLDSEYSKTLLSMSGLNYNTGMGRDKPSGLHQIAYLAALILGGIGGFNLGSEYGGTALAIISAIFFAFVCTTAVGVAAMKFGYRP